MSRRALKKVLWRKKGKKSDAVVPAGDREQNHISLFVAISAAGGVMKPNVLIHKQPKGAFSPLQTNDMVCYHSPKGFMTYDLFYNVMKDVFVKHVENVRRDNGLEGRRAVLVVDGHISRYTLRTAELLKEHHIDLVILPSHTSHVTQPLDIGLNRWIKQVYQQLIHRIKPIILAPKQKPPRRPQKAKPLIKPNVSDEEYEKLMMEQNERLLRARQEGHNEMVCRVGNAPYKRAKIVAAVIEAVASLTPRKIQNAWNASHLYPFYGTPNYTRNREMKLLAQIPKSDRLDLIMRMLQAEFKNGTSESEEPPLLQLISKSDRESLVGMMTETQKAEMLGTEKNTTPDKQESNVQLQERIGGRSSTEEPMVKERGEINTTVKNQGSMDQLQRRGRRRRGSTKDTVSVEERMAQVREGNNTGTNRRGSGKRGKMRKSETVDRGDAKRRRTDEDTENVQRNYELNVDEEAKKPKGKRRGRKGPDLWKGVLTSPEGILWLKDYEKTHQTESKPSSSIVSLPTSQGYIVLAKPFDESDMELSDGEDTVTVTKKIADKFFKVSEESID